MYHSTLSTTSSILIWLQKPGIVRYIVIILGVCFVLTVLRVTLQSSRGDNSVEKHKDDPNCPYVWHGGSPTHKGSCWCGRDDKYCMCTPSLAIDAIIEYHATTETIDKSCEHCQIILVFRKDPPKEFFAIPGGFVNIGETVEQATLREVHEETNLSVHQLHQFKMFSDPLRDSRRHTASIVFRCIVTDIAKMKGGDDAKAVKLIPLKEVLQLPLAFDHRTILYEYIERFHPTILNKQT